MLYIKWFLGLIDLCKLWLILKPGSLLILRCLDKNSANNDLKTLTVGGGGYCHCLWWFLLTDLGTCQAQSKQAKMYNFPYPEELNECWGNG